MSIVNFSIPKPLERRVEKVIKDKGFVSKAEFFRMAAMHFLDHGIAAIDENKRTAYLASAITEEVKTKYAQKKVRTARQQLADI